MQYPTTFHPAFRVVDGLGREQDFEHLDMAIAYAMRRARSLSTWTSVLRLTALGPVPVNY